MRKAKIVIGLTLVCLMVFSTVVAFAADGYAAEVQTEDPSKLIVYFSHTGNGAFVANHIQALTGADVFILRPVEPYSADFAITVARAGNELETGIFPELIGRVDNLEDYDVIFLGSPNWFGTLSTPMQAFLDTHDLSGMTIAPFIMFGRGGLMNTITDLNELLPDSTILEEFGMGGDYVMTSQPEIVQWLYRIDMISFNYIPARAFFAGVGAEVEWIGETRSVRVSTSDSRVVVFDIGSDSALVDGVSVELSAPATLVNGVTMIPSDFVEQFTQ